METTFIFIKVIEKSFFKKKKNSMTFLDRGIRPYNVKGKAHPM